MTDPLYVCVGPWTWFSHWCKENLGMDGMRAEKTNAAVGIVSGLDMRKLWGRHGPMLLIDLGGTGLDYQDLIAEVSNEVLRNNYTELLRLEAQ
jgi:hypothetical protein